MMIRNNKIKLAISLKSFALGGVEKYVKTILSNIDHNKFEYILYCNNNLELLNYLNDLKNQSIRIVQICEQSNKLPELNNEVLIIKNHTLLRRLYHLLIPKSTRESLYSIIDAFRYTPIMYRHFSKEKIELIHFNSGSLLSLMPEVLAAIFARIPKKIITVHTCLTTNKFSFVNFFNRVFIFVILLKMDIIIAVSNSVKQALISQVPFIKKKIEVIYNGINLDEVDLYKSSFSIEREKAMFSLSSGCFIIGVIARLAEGKGHKILIEAVHIIKRKMPASQFVVLIVGDGPKKKELISLIYGKNIEKYFKFLGHVNDVYKIICICDLVVMPSQMEGFSYVLIEAMACSKPIVATQVGGMQEVVGESAGILVSPNCPDSLANAILSFLQNAKQGELIGNIGRNKVEAQFQLSHMIDKTIKIYNSLNI